MLILGRKEDEVIYVDGPCWIRVVDIRITNVRLGIQTVDPATAVVRDNAQETRIPFPPMPKP